MKRMIGFGIALIVAGFAVAGTLLVSGGGTTLELPTFAREELPVTEPVPVSPASSPFEYPITLWDEKIEGETILMVHVTEEGAVDSAYVLTSSGHGAFDAAALAGSATLRFEPGRRGDEAIASWARLPVRFRMTPDSAGRGDA